MCAIRSLATNSSFSLLSLLQICDDISEGKRQNKVAEKKMKYPVLYEVEENQLISPANYSIHAGHVERVQHYVHVDAKHLELGVAGERYKPVRSVDRH